MAPTITASELISYAEATGDSHPDGPDVWVSDAGLDASHVLPGIPKAYLQEVLEGRALYALGVPLDWKMVAFREIFRNCGQVLKCPCVIDLGSQQVFRWAIMSSPEEADAVLRDINGLKLAGRTIHFCRALPPGATFVFSEEYPLLEFLKWDMRPPLIEAQNGQDNPLLPVLPQQPVAVIIQPPTPQTGHAQLAQLDKGNPQQAPTVYNPTDRPAGNLDFIIDQFDDSSAPQVMSWAKVVSARGGPQVMDLKPQYKTASSAPRLPTFARDLAVTRARSDEPLAEQMRVVFLLDIPDHITLTNISDGIKEGALHSIRFGIDENDGKRYAGIIFQHAQHAGGFFRAINKEHLDSKPDRFTFLTEAVRGKAFPADDMIRLMGTPTFASRRLTVAKSRFFFMYKESDFRHFCETIVGPDQIQCIWLYNGGNATIVFADVKSAATIKDELDTLCTIARFDENNSFYGLRVSYSKDPCLQQIHFVTAVRGPR